MSGWKNNISPPPKKKRLTGFANSLPIQRTKLGCFALESFKFFCKKTGLNVERGMLSCKPETIFLQRFMLKETVQSADACSWSSVVCKKL